MSVLVLCYHNINKKGVVTPEKLESELSFLAEEKYFPVSIQDLYGYVSGEKTLPEKSVHLTFDDGYSDNYTEALPLVKRYGFKATGFLITSRIGLLGYLDWKNIFRMKDSGLFGFESHSHTHVRYFLAAPDKKSLVSDLRLSRKIIAGRLGEAPEHFCYPYGEYDAAFVASLKKAGFLSGFTLESGLNFLRQNPYKIMRVESRGDHRWLKRRLSGLQAMKGSYA